MAARGGVADRRPLSGERSRSLCGDVSFCLSRRKSGGPWRATGVVPGVIAGELMERVIGERGASADRSGRHPAARLGTVAHLSPHEWNSHRTDLNFNAPRLSKRLHRFTMWPLGCKPFRLLWPSVALRPSSVLKLRACQRRDIPEVASAAWQTEARCRGSDPALRAMTFRFIYHGGRAEGHGGPQESCRG